MKTISTSQKSTKYIFIYTDVHLNDVKSIIDTNIDILALIGPIHLSYTDSTLVLRSQTECMSYMSAVKPHLYGVALPPSLRCIF